MVIRAKVYKEKMLKQYYRLGKRSPSRPHNEDGYEGKAWYVTPATADGYSSAQQPRRYWDIELDGEGYAVSRNKYDRGVDMFPCYKYCMAHGYFTLCLEGGSDKLDIQPLKLM